MDVRILGPLEVLSCGERVAVGGGKQAAVLALLATSAGTAVSRDALVEALWPERPPPTATTTIQVYVSRLRKVLGDRAIVSEGGGYRLDTDLAVVDARRFLDLLAAGRESHTSGRIDEAAALFSEALSLWRGPVLSDFAYDSWAQHEIGRLQEERLACLEERIDADLAVGGGPDLVAELRTLVAEHPLRERLRRQLMVALYRSGRQSDALAEFQAARSALIDDLGIEPSVELQEMYRAILNHDESLHVAAPSTARSVLPTPPTELIGRKRELAEVIELLRSVRLLTITGPGGCGKTRLALAAAAEVISDYRDGVLFVSLAPVRDPELLEPTVSSVLEAKSELAAFLRTKELLLVLDNLEHLLPDAASFVGGLIDVEGVRVLATSRERLAIRPEQEYVLPTLGADDAVALFAARARQLRPDFQADSDVVEITRRLDGLPLAIELAASRVKVLAPTQILDRLSRKLDVLGSGARDMPERQRSLRATIEWSHDLLGPEEQRLLTNLAVFAGPFDVEAAEGVANADLEVLQALVDKSLLQPADAGRFVMLETIREFAGGYLAEDPAAAELVRSHALHFASLAERVETASRVDGPADLFVLLDHDLANIRAAIAATRDTGNTELLLRFAIALWRYWSVRGFVAEGKAVLEEAVAAVERPPAGALLGLCALRLMAGASAADLMPAAEKALEACIASGEDLNCARAWNLVGKIRGSFLAQLDAGDRAFEQGLVHAQRAGDRTEMAESIWGMTLSALAGPQPVEAAIERADKLLLVAADDPEPRAFCLSARGALEAMAGRFDAGRELLREGTLIFERLGDNVWAANNAQLSFIVEMLAGDPEAAARALRDSFDRLEAMGEEGFLSTIAGLLAHALYELGAIDEAERFSRASEEAAAPDDVLSQILWRSSRAKILASRGEVERSLELARRAVALAHSTDFPNTQGDALLDLAEVLALAGRADEARDAGNEAAHRFAAKGNTAALERASRARSGRPAVGAT